MLSSSLSRCFDYGTGATMLLMARSAVSHSIPAAHERWKNPSPLSTAPDVPPSPAMQLESEARSDEPLAICSPRATPCGCKHRATHARISLIPPLDSTHTPVSSTPPAPDYAGAEEHLDDAVDAPALNSPTNPRSLRNCSCASWTPGLSFTSVSSMTRCLRRSPR